MASNVTTGAIVSTAAYNGGWTSYGQNAAYAGYYASSKYAACVRMTTPAFAGKSVCMLLTLVGHTFRPSGGDPVLRWALCSSDANKSSYVNPGAVTSDPYQMASGTITFTDENKVKELVIETDALMPSTEYYLVLWGYQSGTVGRITLDVPSKLSMSVEWNEPETYIVSFDSLGVGTAPEPVEVKIGESFELPVLATDGFVFGGWAETAGAASGATGTYTPTATMTLYAVWAVAYIVSFNANGHGTAPDPVTVGAGSSIELPVITAEGYKFIGWSETGSKNDAVTGTYTPASSVVLFAIWKSVASIIRYNNNGEIITCRVMANNNGTAVRCRLRYNDNGRVVDI